MSILLLIVVVFDISQLKRLRLQAGMTQSDLAIAAGVSQSLIAKIERGVLDPSLSNARKIMVALDSRSDPEITVDKVMSRKIVMMTPSETVIDAVKLMKRKGFSQILVGNDDHLLGMITERVILDHVDSLDTLKVSDVLVAPPPSVDVSTPISAIISLLAIYPCVTVMYKGKIKGIVTKSDVMVAAVRKR